jgi:hypothetical protein
MTTLKFNALAITLALTAIIPSLAYSAKEGGGREGEVTRFSCIEKDPQDSQNPYLARLSVRSGGALAVLFVREESGNPLWAGYVKQDTRIKCEVACEIYENQLQQVSFGVNTMAPITATYSSPSKVIAFDCVGNENSDSAEE